MNLNDMMFAATQLNLDAIKTKLMHAESGEGWTKAKADAVEKEYRRFLCLMKLYPEEATAPLVDVDTFWHYHILDTMKYAADCELVFGYFLHHYPYIGLRGEDDEQVRLDSGDRMKTLYEATFGEAYPAAANHGEKAAGTGFKLTGFALGSAWCGGAWPKKPGQQATAIGTGTAWCGGDWPKKPAGKSAAISIDVGTAWCGGDWPKKPVAEAITIDVGTAWCGGAWPKKPGADERTGAADGAAQTVH